MRLILSGFGDGSTKTLQIFEDDRLISEQYEQNCAFLCEGEEVLFAISELDPISKIHIFSKDGIKLLDSRPINGGGLCHISYIKKSSLLVGACYGTGNIFWVKVEKGRFCGDIFYHQQGETQGRAHSVVANENESLLFSANIMQDRIYSYKLTDNGLEENGFLQLPLGIGPRHILPLFTNSYYVITEYSNEILLIKDGKLVNRYSTLAKDFAGVSYCSALCMSPPSKANPQFLYAANRGENTIAVFAVNEDYTLEEKGRFDCGDFPRHIALVGDKSVIASANEHGNCVCLFSIDNKTGMATKKIKEIPFAEPSFVL